MKIGEIARETKLSVDTLRYYEKMGLIDKPRRTQNGYRDYSSDTVQYLGFIRRAKAVGFSLGECRDLMGIFLKRSTHTCGDVKKLSEAKLRTLEVQMAQLKDMHKTLKAISDACCGGDESALHCSILASLEGEDSKLNEVNKA